MFGYVCMAECMYVCVCKFVSAAVSVLEHLCAFGLYVFISICTRILHRCDSRCGW